MRSVAFITFHTFACKLAGKIIDKCMENEKCDWTFSSTATSFKFCQYNILPIILTFLFINCSEFIFLRDYSPLNSHTNTVNLALTCRSTQNATLGAIFLRNVDFNLLPLSLPKCASLLPSPSTANHTGGYYFLYKVVLYRFREQHSSSPSARPFTSFSVKLSGIVHELHRCLLQALMAETSSTTKAQILKVYLKYVFVLLKSNALKRSHRLSFCHLFYKFLISLMAGQSDFQDRREHVIKNVACLFIKFQSWKWAGFCAKARESVLILAKNKFYSCPNFGQI